jgi:hypothetical protein
MQQYKTETLLRMLVQEQTKHQTTHEQGREFTITIAFVRHQSSSSSLLCSRNRPSVCIHDITHHMAAGWGRQTAHNHTTTSPTSPFSLRQQDLAASLSLSFGNQPFGIAVGKPQAWRCWPPTINHHTVTYFTILPDHTIYFWRFGRTEGGLTAPSTYQRSPQSSINDINQWVSSSTSQFQ